MDLNMEIEIKILPTVRDEDGLAISSRNLRLNVEERQSALCLYGALLKARSMFASNTKSTEEMIEEMASIIKKSKYANA